MRKSKSPSFRHLKSLTKMSETSLFAELVKDRNRREAEAKLAAAVKVKDHSKEKPSEMPPLPATSIPMPIETGELGDSSNSATQVTVLIFMLPLTYCIFSIPEFKLFLNTV